MALLHADPDPIPLAACIEPPTERQIYEQGRDRVRRTLRFYGVRGGDVDDQMQQVFIIALERLPECRCRHAPWAWLAGIARNVARQHCRGRTRNERRIDPHSDLTTMPASCEQEAEALNQAHIDLLLRFVDELRNEDRKDVLVRHYVEGQSLPSIKEELGRSLNTLKWQIREGEREIKEALTRHEARERRETRTMKIAAVLAMFGVSRILAALRNLDLHDGMREEVGEPGFGGGDEGGTITPALPPVGRIAALPWAMSSLVIAAFLIVVELAMVIGATSAPLHESRSALAEVRPDAVAAVVAASASASALTSPSSTSSFPGPAPSAARPPAASAAAGPKVACMPDRDTEHEVLDKAQRALLAHRPAEALAAVEEHALLCHGGGRLAEWRERLRIGALLAAGRLEEAQASMENFALAHPHEPMVRAWQQQSRAPR